LTPVRVDASCTLTSTHGSYDTGVALAEGLEDDDAGEPVLAVVDEAHAAVIERTTPINTRLALRNMSVVSFNECC
jgi:hypothetical protein